MNAKYGKFDYSRIKISRNRLTPDKAKKVRRFIDKLDNRSSARNSSLNLTNIGLNIEVEINKAAVKKLRLEKRMNDEKAKLNNKLPHFSTRETQNLRKKIKISDFKHKKQNDISTLHKGVDYKIRYSKSPSIFIKNNHFSSYTFKSSNKNNKTRKTPTTEFLKQFKTFSYSEYFSIFNKEDLTF
jgi:hypothetical protein